MGFSLFSVNPPCSHKHVGKVFARLFQKAAQWRARSPPRPPQRTKKILGVSLLLTFLFAPPVSKRKVATGFL